MSKQAATEQEIQAKITGARQDLAAVTNFIGKELYTYAQNNGGKIDLKNENFANVNKNLVNADPDAPQNQGKPVFSLLGTEKNAKKNFDALNADPEKFNSINQEMKDTRANLEINLNSETGIRKIITDYLTLKSIGEIAFFEGSPPNQKPMPPPEKALFAQTLRPYVTFPKDSDHLFKERGLETGELALLAKKRVAEFFSVEGELTTGGWCTPDRTKLTEANMKKFGEALSKDFEDFSVALKERQEVKTHAETITNRAIGILEKEKKFSITEDQKKQISAKMSLKLAEFGSGYLEKKGSIISQELAESLATKKTFFGKKLNTSDKNLEDVTTKITKTHLDESKKFAEDPANKPKAPPTVTAPAIAAAPQTVAPPSIQTQKPQTRTQRPVAKVTTASVAKRPVNPNLRTQAPGIKRGTPPPQVQTLQAEDKPPALPPRPPARTDGQVASAPRLPSRQTKSELEKISEALHQSGASPTATNATTPVHPSAAKKSGLSPKGKGTEQR